jgi:hypothetical protein
MQQSYIQQASVPGLVTTKGDSMIMESNANMYCEKLHNLDWSTLQLCYHSGKWKKIIHEIKTLQKTESATSHDGWCTGHTSLIYALRGWY